LTVAWRYSVYITRNARSAPVVLPDSPLHGEAAVQRLAHRSEDHEQAVALALEEDAVVPVDAGHEDALALEDGLQEVDDTELRSPA